MATKTRTRRTKGAEAAPLPTAAEPKPTDAPVPADDAEEAISAPEATAGPAAARAEPDGVAITVAEPVLEGGASRAGQASAESDREEDAPTLAEAKPDGEQIGAWPVHPAASVFPLNPPGAQRELAGSIEATGLLHAIVLLEDEVLDGRNRLRACLKLGIEPRFEEAPPDTDPVDYVLRANLHRRHLTLSQRAIAAARLEALPPGRPTAETRQACRSTTKEAAALFKVSPRLVRGARAVRRRGVPALVRAVERGKLTVGRAESVAKASPERQADVLERLEAAATQAERGAVLRALEEPTGAEGGDDSPDEDAVSASEVVRLEDRQRCVRRLATILEDAHDPAGELSEVANELADLIGLARHAVPAASRGSRA